MSFLFSSSVYSKRRFPDQDLALRGVWRVKKISFYLQQVFFSFRPQSIQRDVFLTKIWLSGVFDGSRKYLFTFSKSFLFSSTVYSKRCFPDQDWLLGVRTGQENMFLPSASPSLFSFRPPSIQGDVFYDQEMVNRPQWITTSEADTDSRLSVPGWSRVLNGPSLTMEVNIYPKKYQYPGSETVWYKNVWQMDFYSPLIPSGGLNAEPMVNAAYEELFEARLGIATSNSMCLSLGKESCKSGRFFWWG